MPLSLRLPSEIESQIEAFSERHGLSKSAVVLRSIREFLAAHARPRAYDIYHAEMEAAARLPESEVGDRVETRPHKLRFQEAVRRKHAERTGQAERYASVSTGKSIKRVR